MPSTYSHPQEGHMQFKSKTIPPPRLDELSEILRLLGEVKVSLVKLAKDTTQPPASQEKSEEVRNAKWTPA